MPFTTWYTDMHGDLLPINNDDNFLRAVTTARPLLRVFVQRKGKKFEDNCALKFAYILAEKLIAVAVGEVDYVWFRNNFNQLSNSLHTFLHDLFFLWINFSIRRSIVHDISVLKIRI